MNESIQSINKLATILQCPREYLLELSSRSSNCYHPYLQTKKNGKKRKIDNPNDELKLIQDRINQNILKPIIDNLPPYMHGAMARRSSITNAKTHLGKESILALDLENCFPNIKRDMVYTLFKEEFHCIPEVAKILTRLTTRNHGLPQGAPTSASLCNLILAPVCERINIECQKRDCTFSQYIDDMFASGSLDDVKELLPVLVSILRSTPHKLNKKKIKIMTRNTPMKVTGVLLNTGQITAGKKKLKEIRQEIMRLKDYDEYIICFKKGKPHKKYIRNMLSGKVNNVYSANKTQGRKLRRLLNDRLRCLKLKK